MRCDEETAQKDSDTDGAEADPKSFQGTVEVELDFVRASREEHAAHDEVAAYQGGWRAVDGYSPGRVVTIVQEEER
jgi:hypothetical protein